MPRTKLGTAPGYFMGNKEAFTRYLENGICERDNMAANSIRPFIVGRETRLFKGAKARAAVCSIIETCKANGVNPEKYLIYLYTKLPNEEWLGRKSSHTDGIAALESLHQSSL